MRNEKTRRVYEPLIERRNSVEFLLILAVLINHSDSEER
jgi:hypothetical protein